MIACALFLLAIALIPLVRAGSCRHTDEDGRSLLSWSYDDRAQRLRGFCWNCYRFTSGWPVPKGGRS